MNLDTDDDDVKSNTTSSNGSSSTTSSMNMNSSNNKIRTNPSINTNNDGSSIDTSNNANISTSPMSLGKRELEYYGQWLLTIPRDEIPSLMHTPEYAAFKEAFQNLERAHLACISQRNEEHTRRTQELSVNVNRNVTDAAADVIQNYKNEATSGAAGGAVAGGFKVSFLQHMALDDIILRIFEFLPCQTLVKTSEICHRFNLLTKQSAKQRISTSIEHPNQHHYHNNHNQHTQYSHHDVEAYQYFNLLHIQTPESSTYTSSSSTYTSSSTYAQSQTTLSSTTSPSYSSSSSSYSYSSASQIMKLLRAKEQIQGINPYMKPTVQIPLLGLPRRIHVSNCGDEEYNGIYFCTGSNGNGFLFTKPRTRRRRRRRSGTRRLMTDRDTNNNDTSDTDDSTTNNDNDNDEEGVDVRAHIHQLHHPHNEQLLPQIVENNNNNNNNNNNADELRQRRVIGHDREINEEAEDEHSFFSLGRTPRCIIGKRFSNEV